MDQQQDNPPPIDPDLSAHLEEATILLEEIGASGTVILRLPRMARLFVDFGDGPQVYPLAELGWPAPGVIVIALFTAADGGPAGMVESVAERRI